MNSWLQTYGVSRNRGQESQDRILFQNGKTFNHVVAASNVALHIILWIVWQIGLVSLL